MKQQIEEYNQKLLKNIPIWRKESLHAREVAARNSKHI